MAAERGLRRPWLGADHGLVEGGRVRIAERQLAAAHISAVPFHAFDVNPDTEMIEVGCAAARPHAVDAISVLGGGSTQECLVFTAGAADHLRSVNLGRSRMSKNQQHKIDQHSTA